MNLVTQYVNFILPILIFLGMISTIVYFYKKQDTESKLVDVLEHHSSGPIMCQTCKVEPADRAVSLMEVTGMLLAFKYKSYIVLSCSKCYMKSIGKAMLHDVFLGWWGIKALIFNVFAVIGNLTQIFGYVRLNSLDGQVAKAKIKLASDMKKQPKKLDDSKKVHKKGYASDKYSPKEPKEKTGPKNTLAIISLVVSILIPWVGIPLSIYTMFKINGEPEEYTGKNMAIAALVISVIRAILPFLPLLFL